MINLNSSFFHSCHVYLEQQNNTVTLLALRMAKTTQNITKGQSCDITVWWSIWTKTQCIWGAVYPFVCTGAIPISFRWLQGCLTYCTQDMQNRDTTNNESSCQSQYRWPTLTQIHRVNHSMVACKSRQSAHISVKSHLSTNGLELANLKWIRTPSSTKARAQISDKTVWPLSTTLTNAFVTKTSAA
jgi:hypothetical protein